MKYLKLILLSAIVVACNTNDPVDTELTEEQIITKAETIQQNVITMDTHNDINVKNFTDSVNYTQELSNQVNIPKMKKGGMDVTWLVVYAGQDSLNEAGYAKAHQTAIDKFEAIHRLVEDYAPDQIELATSSEDVRRIHAAGKLVAMIGVENGYQIGSDIKNVEEFYDLGARYMSLSHNGHSQLCDSNTGERDSVWLYNGVSDLGKEVIAEMNRLGMMIDVSHPSKESMRDMIELSKAPIIASHSSARALCDHSRNLDDEQLEWLKENGGVIQTVAFAGYVNKEKSKKRSEALKDIQVQIADSLSIKWITSWSEFGKLSETEQMDYLENRKIVSKIANEKSKLIADFPAAVNVADFVDHIDYMVNKIGIDHVGISTDFDGGGGVDGWNDASETLNVTIELVRRGYSEDEIGQLWSGNLLRVLDEVEKVAKEIQAAN